MENNDEEDFAEQLFFASAPAQFSNKVSDFKEEHSQLGSSWSVGVNSSFMRDLATV